MNVFVILVSFLLVCTSVPSFAEEKPKGEQIKEKTAEIKKVVNEAVEAIKVIAEKDNAEVASSLIPKVSEAIKKATTFLETELAGLESKELTEAEGKKIVSDLQKIVIGVQGEAQADLQKLTKDARNEIHAEFLMAFGSTTKKVKELLQILTKKKE